MSILRQVMKRVMESAAADGGGGASDAAEASHNEEVQQRAREMGWTPREQWRGNPEGWIDATEYVRRGEQVMPILQANLRKTEAELAALRRKDQQREAALQAATESIQVLTNLSTEQSRQAAKEKRRELLRQQAAARTAGDADTEIDLGEQIADVTAQINAAPVGEGGETKPNGKGKVIKPAATTQQPPANDPINDPEYQAWAGANPWFGVDRRKTAMATAIGQEIRENPEFAGLVGKAFFDRVTMELNKVFTPARSNGGNKVEGGTNNGAVNSAAADEGITGAARGKSFADLPQDAKDACERQSKWVVGEGRAFKDMAAWRKHYINIYFNS